VQHQTMRKAKASVTLDIGDAIDPDGMTAFLKDQPIGRKGRSEKIEAAVLWLCSPGASFNVGVALPVDGGFVTY
jgi:NAD(P)-dependent dehydrogenase (short-subunit alcohol dehydrogenase family)